MNSDHLNSHDHIISALKDHLGSHRKKKTLTKLLVNWKKETSTPD